MQPRLTIALMLLMAPAAFAVNAADLSLAVPAVAVAVASFIGIATMVASATSDPRLEAWAKTEVREFLGALVIIGVMYALFVLSNNIAAVIGGGSNYLTTSMDILEKNWTAGYDGAFEYLIRAAAKVRTGATYAPYISVPLWYVGINYSTGPLQGAGILLMPLNMAAAVLTNAIFIAEGIRMLIVFLLVVGPPILFPLAACIRMIPFTRRLGNTVIAITMAGMVFLPVSVIVANALNSTLGASYPDPTKKMDLKALDADPWAMTVFQPMCAALVLRAMLGMTDLVFALVVCLPLLFTPWTAALYPVCWQLVQNVIYPIINVIFQLVNTILVIAWEASLGDGSEYAIAAYTQIAAFLAEVNNLVLLGYIDFIVIGIITIGGARSLSSFLGGEWYMAGIQRLL